MKLCTIFKPLLYYLLLCYGKKLAYAEKGRGSSAGQAGSAATPRKHQTYSIEVDIKQKESTSELIYNVEFDGAETFVCRKGYVIREVYKGDKLIWKYEAKDPNNPEPYPDKVYIIFDENGKKMANVRYPYDELVVEVDINNKQHTDYVFYFKYEDETELFICKTGYLISKVTKGQKVIWQYDETVGGDYPNRVVIGLDEKGKKQATVRFPGDEVQLLVIDVMVRQSTEYCDYVRDAEGYDAFIPKPGYVIHRLEKNGKFIWECVDGYYPERVQIIIDEKGKPVARFKFPEEAPPPPEVMEEVKAPEMPKVKKPEPIPEKTEVSINLHAKETTTFYTYVAEGNVATYTALEDFGFNNITRKEAHIWSTVEKKKLVKEITRDGIDKFKSMENVTLHHIDGTITHLTKLGKQWTELSNKIILNIKNKNTVHSNYTEEYDLGTFTPKHNCVFNVIQLQRRCSCGRRTGDYYFWQGADNEFSRRVITNYHFNLDRHKYLSLFLEDGTIKHYHSPTGQYGWKEVSEKINLDIKHMDNEYRYYYAAYDQLPTYVCNHNFLFTQVVNGNEVIWRGDKNEYATSVFTDRTDQKNEPSNIAIILNDGYKLLLTKMGGSWQETQKFPGFELDILEQYSTTTINYVQNTEGTAHSFTTKHGFLINCLKDECKEFWRASDEKEYARKVIINGDDLIIKPKHGDRIQFKRVGEGKWNKVD